MPYYTPLRYPGGKRRLVSAVTGLLEKNGLKDIQYAEPYAGGASIALALLLEEYASYIHINDLSRPVYAFWHTVLNDTKDLCLRVESTEITMDEWYRQRAVYDERETADLSDLGFATLFLNRTNRSGILSGGVIGGKQQKGAWPIDARFGKDELIKRIRKIGRYRGRIHLYQQDALEFTNDTVAHLGLNSFVFYDPPYIENGKDLYLNDYTLDGHRQLAERVAQLRQPWAVTYDYDAALAHDLYPRHRRVAFVLSYSAQERRGGKEAMFLSPHMRLPAEWTNQDIRISAQGSEYPIFGTLEAMPSHPGTDEGPEAAERFVSALKTVIAVPKDAVPNPFKKPKNKKKKPADPKD